MCYRALLGVAQHFTRLRLDPALQYLCILTAALSSVFLVRNYMWGLLGALAVLRRLRYWLKRLLRWLRLRNVAQSVR